MIKRKFLFCFLLLTSIAFAAQDERILTYQEIDELIENNRLEKAERALIERLSKDKSNYIILTALGSVYIEKGERKKALKSLNNAVTINPDYPLAHFFLGRLYFLMQESEKAVAEFSIFTEKMVISPETNDETKKFYINKLHYICETYFTLKRYALCRKKIDTILKLDPNNQTALYNLAVYYYVYEHSRPKAYELFKKAQDLDPTTYIAKRAQYAIEYIRTNPDSRVMPDFSFIDKPQ